MGYTDFFQSREFSEFQEKIPYRGKTWIVKTVAKGKTLATCLVIRMVTRLHRCFFWIPYGPIFHTNDKDEKAKALESIFEDLQQLSKDEKAIFSRIEPKEDLMKYFTFERLRKFTFKKSKKIFCQEHTLILDLSQDETALRAGMHEKGRYNIGLAQRDRVTVQRFDDLKAMGASFAFNEFYRLLEKIAQAQRFRQNPQSYYETLLEFLGPKKMASFFVAQHEGRIIGGLIIIWYGDTATYYYGASSHEDRAFMAPYLLHWEAIREAKKRGFHYYDFFGIAPPSEKNHPLRGVTEFKKKFGGFEVHYGKAFDLVHKPFWYWFY